MFVKINKIKGKINTIIGLATNAALNDVKNQIPNIIDIIKKTDYDA